MELMIVLALIAVLALVGGIIEESAKAQKKAPAPVGAAPDRAVRTRL